MAAVDADLEARDAGSALARLDDFIQKHTRTEDALPILWELKDP